MYRTILGFALAALLLAPHADGADDGASVRHLIAGYRDWKPTTDKPVIVPMQIILGCVSGPSPEERSPHEMRSILVYVNPTGREAYDRKTSFPNGTVIVKEKRGKGSEDKVALGIMIKHGKSWEYSYINTEGDVVSGERLLHCARCHAGAKNDSVFGRPAPTTNVPPTNIAPNGKF